MVDKAEYYAISKESSETEVTLDNKSGSHKNCNERMTDNGVSMKSKEKPNLFHSVSIVVEPVIEDDTKSCIPVRLSPSDIKSSETVEAGSQRSICDLDNFIFENQRKRSQEEEEIVQSIFADAKLRKEEFARLLEEHAQIVSEINRAETTLL